MLANKSLSCLKTFVRKSSSTTPWSRPFLSISSVDVYSYYSPPKVTGTTSRHFGSSTQEIIPGVKSSGEKYVMVYTCGVCDTRSSKKISKQGYHHGCVIIRCPNCSSLHLIADHIGAIDQGWNVESFLKENGGNFKMVDDNVIELTTEDITGLKNPPASL